MSKVIAISNQKGGVGKTTTCVNLSAYLAAMGKKVLILDIDLQGNATSGLGVDKSKLDASMYDLLTGESEFSQTVLKTGVDGLDIVPSSIDMAGAEAALLAVREGREKILKKIIAKIRNEAEYDFITIDCPPSLGLVTINALTAADSTLIPILCEFYPLEGLAQLMNTIRQVKRQLNPALDVEGVVLTMYDSRSNLVISVTEEIHKYFGKKVFGTKIPRNIRLSEAPSHGLPVMQYDPRSAGGLAYKFLAEEFLERNNMKYKKVSNDLELKKRI